MKYIALLRGINVGGNNKISMPELKLLFESLGFSNVITYINSGNIIFDNSDNSEIEIQKKCEDGIKEQFNLNILVLIISVQDYEDALKHAPSWWDEDKESKHNAIFVMPSTTAKEIVDNIGSNEFEQVYYYKNVIFWSAPLKTFSHTRWAQVSKPKGITIRNANTTKKLLQIAEQ